MSDVWVQENKQWLWVLWLWFFSFIKIIKYVKVWMFVTQSEIFIFLHSKTDKIWSWWILSMSFLSIWSTTFYLREIHSIFANQVLNNYTNKTNIWKFSFLKFKNKIFAMKNEILKDYFHDFFKKISKSNFQGQIKNKSWIGQTRFN